MDDKQKKFQDNIKELLRSIGEDSQREGLIDTPKRVFKSYQDLYGGYKIDTDKLLQKALFTTDNQNMVIVDNIDFFSTCEHHMLPIIGKAYIGYLPSKKVVGLSKIPRLVEAFGKRLQIQENMTSQIAHAIFDNIGAKGVGVVLKARHLCMEMRGVQKIGSFTSTFYYLGEFEKDNIKNEFLSHINP